MSSAFPRTTYLSSASRTQATNRSNVFFVFCLWGGRSRGFERFDPSRVTSAESNCRFRGPDCSALVARSLRDGLSALGLSFRIRGRNLRPHRASRLITRGRSHPSASAARDPPIHTGRRTSKMRRSGRRPAPSSFEGIGPRPASILPRPRRNTGTRFRRRVDRAPRPARKSSLRCELAGGPRPVHVDAASSGRSSRDRRRDAVFRTGGYSDGHTAAPGGRGGWAAMEYGSGGR